MCEKVILKRKISYYMKKNLTRDFFKCLWRVRIIWSTFNSTKEQWVIPKYICLCQIRFQNADYNKLSCFVHEYFTSLIHKMHFFACLHFFSIFCAFACTTNKWISGFFSTYLQICLLNYDWNWKSFFFIQKETTTTNIGYGCVTMTITRKLQHHRTKWFFSSSFS